MISDEPSLLSPNCVAATATTAARLVHCTLESRQADIARLLLAVKRAKNGTSRRMKRDLQRSQTGTAACAHGGCAPGHLRC